MGFILNGSLLFSNMLLLAFKVAKEFARVLYESCFFRASKKCFCLDLWFSQLQNVWDNIVSERENAGTHLEASPMVLECNLKIPLPFLLLLDNKGEIIVTPQSWEGDERCWQVESASTGVRNLSLGNLSFEDCESSFLTKCPSSLGKLSKTGSYQGMLLPEVMRWTCACSESWNVTVKNH